MSDQETWRNAGKGIVAVRKYDRWGDLKHQMVRSGQTISLSLEERMLNQEQISNKDYDFFSNGQLLPVKLADSAEDAAEIASNPNMKSESDLEAMFKLQWKKFETEVAEIRNPTALHRLRELAIEKDATVRKLQVIEDRLREVDPTGYNPDADTVTAEPIRGINPVKV